MYSSLIKSVKNEKGQQKQNNYNLALITILHAFDKLSDEKFSGTLERVFPDYFKAYNKHAEEFCFGDLDVFLTELESGQLNAITKSIYDVFFKK